MTELMRPFVKQDRHIVLSLLAMLWLAFITALYGPGMDVDAVYYMLLARKLAHTGDILHFDSDAPGHWPPLYTMLMSIPFVLKVSYFWGAYVINILLYGISTYLASKQIDNLLQERNMRWVARLFTFFGFPILYIYVKAQSEILFMTLIIALYHFSIQYFKKPELSRIWTLGFIAALLCLTRYAGLPYVLAVTISLLLQKDKTLQEKIRHGLTLLTIALLPLLLWVLRPILAGTPHTFEYPNTYTLGFWEGIDKTVRGMINWLVPDFVGWYVQYPIMIIVLISAFYLYFKKGPLNPVIQLYTVSTFLYMGFIIWSATMGYCSEPDLRFLAPLFFPLYLMCLYLLTNWPIKGDMGDLYKFFTIIGFSIITICILISGIAYGIEKHFDGGGGYRTVRLMESPLQKWISVQPKMNILYTNSVPAILLIAQETPNSIYNLSNSYSAHKAPKNLKTDGSYVIWYFNPANKGMRNYLNPPDTFLKAHHFHCIDSFIDGKVYYSTGK